ncbi:MAG TPA: hypothetical protein VM597_16205 [Gemmataceae bacterium]|nr:hypothetical protein [Gemmataceae bacterium]
MPATFTVLNGLDGGAGSLRAAIAAANDETTNPGPDVINFDPAGTAVALTTGQLTINSDITITGPATGVRIARDAAAPGFRIFSVNAGKTAALSGLTITGGYAGEGGGLHNNGTLTMTNCTVSDNTATIGGCLFSRGTLTMTNCTLNGNSVNFIGGGLFLGGTTTLNNTTIGGNRATGSNGIGGGVWIVGLITMTNCTVSGNYAGGEYGGLSWAGGNGRITLGNTIVAGNSGRHIHDVSGSVASLGNNLIGKTDGSSGWVASDLTGTAAAPLDAMLAPWATTAGRRRRCPRCPAARPSTRATTPSSPTASPPTSAGSSASSSAPSISAPPRCSTRRRPCRPTSRST